MCAPHHIPDTHSWRHWRRAQSQSLSSCPAQSDSHQVSWALYVKFGNVTSLHALTEMQNLQTRQGFLLIIFDSEHINVVRDLASNFKHLLKQSVRSWPLTSVMCRCIIGFSLSSFVPCQYWTSVLFTAPLVGSANAIAGGWGNLGKLFSLGSRM